MALTLLGACGGSVPLGFAPNEKMEKMAPLVGTAWSLSGDQGRLLVEVEDGTYARSLGVQKRGSKYEKESGG